MKQRIEGSEREDKEKKKEKEKEKKREKGRSGGSTLRRAMCCVSLFVYCVLLCCHALCRARAVPVRLLVLCVTVTSP